MEIDISFESVQCSEDSILLVARTVLNALDLPEAQLSILLCDDSFIHPLNRDYRGKDRSTDVLSFAQREGDFAFSEDNLLGDVIVSLETAERQAKERGHPFGQEMEILLVHGILHLLGFDHIEDDEAEVMQAKERELLDQLEVKW